MGSSWRLRERDALKHDALSRKMHPNYQSPSRRMKLDAKVLSSARKKILNSIPRFESLGVHVSGA